MGRMSKRPLSSAISNQRKQATFHDKVMILDWYHENGKKQGKTVSHFRENGFPNLNQPTLSRWLKNESSLREQHDKLSPSKKRHRTTKHPEFDAALSTWVDTLEQKKFVGLTGCVIKEVAKKIYDTLEIPEDERLKLSEGWLSRFKERCGLRFSQSHGEGASAPIETVEKERERLQSLIRSLLEEGYKMEDLYNMDETALFYASVPESGLSREIRSGQKQVKTRITLAITVNYTGNDRVDPVFIGHAKKPRCFGKKSGKELGFVYYHNAKAWMTGEIFRDWISAWNNRLKKQDRRIVLFVDNFSGHRVDHSEITHIRLEFFSPNLTAHVQPCDAGIIRAFKAQYRRLFVLRVIDKLVTAQVDKDLFKIDQLQAMKLVSLAWSKVSDATILNCWKHTGILPEVGVVKDGPDRIDNETKELQYSLDELKICAQISGISLDLVPAEEFADINGESDAIVHCQLGIEDIADLVANKNQEESSAGDEEEDTDDGFQEIKAETALAHVIGLQDFFAQNGILEFESPLEKCHTFIRDMLAQQPRRQAKITEYFQT